VYYHLNISRKTRLAISTYLTHTKIFTENYLINEKHVSNRILKRFNKNLAYITQTCYSHLSVAESVSVNCFYSPKHNSQHC